MEIFRIFLFTAILTGLFHYSPGLGAQDIDAEALVTKESITCEDIAYTSTRLIPGYYREESTDTLQALLYFWEGSCGITEPMMRFTILWQIGTNTFDEQWLPEELPAMLLDYREAFESAEQVHDYFHFGEWEYHTIHEGYRSFTSEMAEDLKSYEDLSPLELFFTDFYSHDFERAIRRLEEGELEGTRLDSLYADHTEEVRPTGYTHGGLYFGFWNPGSSLEALGVHPQVGFSVDVVRGNVLYGLQLRLGFGDTSRPYTTEIGNQLVSTNNFLQVQAGFQAGFDLLNSANHSLFVTGGVGYDGIDPTSHADRDAGRTATLHSININTGLTLHRRFDRGNMFSIMVNYHIVNYNNPGGTDLSGNVLTFGVAYGIITRSYSSESR